MILAENYEPSNNLIDLGSLSAAGEFTEVVKLLNEVTGKAYHRFAFQVTVSGITTNAKVELQGNIDGGTTFTNLIDGGAQMSLTYDGQFVLEYDTEGLINFVRLYFASEAGGTAAVLNVKLKVIE